MGDEKNYSHQYTLNGLIDLVERVVEALGKNKGYFELQNKDINSQMVLLREIENELRRNVNLVEKLKDGLDGFFNKAEKIESAIDLKLKDAYDKIEQIIKKLEDFEKEFVSKTENILQNVTEIKQKDEALRNSIKTATIISSSIGTAIGLLTGLILYLKAG